MTTAESTRSGRAARSGQAAQTGQVDGPNRVASPRLVGREQELELFAEAVTGPPALVVVEGEAGIGKTRLLREVLASPAAQERQVLVAACPPVAEPFPLGPMVDALRGTRRGVHGLALSPLSGALRPLFPEWAADLPPAPEPLEDPQATRHRLLSALAELLDRLGVEVLVLEDAHWADASTLELLLMLTARPGRPVSLVLTYRPEDVPDDSLLPRLTSRVSAEMAQCRVELAALSSEQCGAVVTSMLAAEEVSPTFVAFLHEATEGVPLALEECVRLLRDRRDIVCKDGRWARVTMDELQVPATVRDSVLERVARLDPNAQRVLEAAAVVGESADEALLVEVAALDDEDARRGVGGALASRLLDEAVPGRLAFRHVLASRAVYEAMPASERRRLHHQAGRALERVEPPLVTLPVAQLAQHFREARDLDAWARYGEAAADLALESGDDRTAASILLDVLTEATHPTGRYGHLARKLGEAAAVGTSVLGETGDRVISALRAAIGRQDLHRGERGELRCLLGRFLFQQGWLDDSYAEFERAIPDLADSPALAARAITSLSWRVAGRCSVPELRTWLDRATTLIPRVTSETDRVRLHTDRALALLQLGEEEGWQVLAGLPDEAASSAVHKDLIGRYGNAGVFATAWGRYAMARAWFDAARQHIECSNDQRAHDVERINRAYLDYCVGNWPGLADVVADLATPGQEHPLVRRVATTIQGLLSLATGDTQEAANLRSTSLESQGSGFDDQTLAAAAGLARLQLAKGAVGDAFATTKTTKIAMDKVMATGLWLYATDIAPVRVDALVEFGAIDEAETLVDEFAAWVEGRGIPASVAALATCRANLAAAHGAPSRAAELFTQAADAWAVLPRPYDELLAIERQGRCLLDAGQKDEALTVLGDAQKRLAELGARWDADRVAHLLREHGVEVARVWRGGRRGYGDQLSPRELEVARLVAEGMSNKQVGEALFLSPRTVSRHLSNAMRKLGVHSRTALAKWVTTGGVEDGGGK